LGSYETTAISGKQCQSVQSVDVVEQQIGSYLSGNHSLYPQLCQSASFPSHCRRPSQRFWPESVSKRATDVFAFHRFLSMAFGSLACLFIHDDDDDGDGDDCGRERNGKKKSRSIFPIKTKTAKTVHEIFPQSRCASKSFKFHHGKSSDG